MNAKDDAQVENMYGDMMKEAIRAGLYQYLAEDFEVLQPYMNNKQINVD